MSRSLLAAAALGVGRIATADAADEATRLALDALVDGLGLPHVLLLLPDESGRALYAVGGRGYPDGGAGAEVPIGEGFIGAAVRARQPVRVGGLIQAMSYSRTTRVQAVLAGEAVGRQIPLPGLAQPQSVLVVPLFVRGALVAVLAAESERPLAFDEATEHAVGIVGAALAGHLALLQAADDDPAGAPPRPSAGPESPLREVELFLADDSVFIDHQYVIKGVAGRILVKLLREHADGRREFTNRELRLDRWLQLPPINDNLENRLLLLRQRLEDRDFGVHLARTGRGRFEVSVSFRASVVERP